MKTESLKRGLAVVATLLFTTVNFTSFAAESSNNSMRSITVSKPQETKECKSLPKEYTTIDNNGTPYFEVKGRYYVKSAKGFKPTTPPAGLKIEELPKGSTSFTLFDENFYNYRGVVYQSAANGGYEVTKPEVGMILSDLPETTTREVTINNERYIEADGLMYKPDTYGANYIVACTFDSLGIISVR